jgi:hypothetical protein
MAKQLQKAGRGLPAASPLATDPLPELPSQSTPGPGSFDVLKSVPWVKPSSNKHAMDQRALRLVLGVVRCLCVVAHSFAESCDG